MSSARAKGQSVLHVRTTKEAGGRLSTVKVTPDIEVAAADHCLCFWSAGREVRIGPLTPEQIEKLIEDLEYDLVAEESREAKGEERPAPRGVAK
jgi:hypothetical protein